MIAKFFIRCVNFYQKHISPAQKGENCRFLPTCSEYAKEAFAVHGAGKGLILALHRFLRCNPFGKRGYDPVPEKGNWRAMNRNVYRS